MILILISKIICTFFHFSDVGMMEKCYCASGKHVPKSITCPAWEWKPLKKPLHLKKSGIAPGIFVFNVERQLYHTVFIVPLPIARLMILFWRNTKNLVKFVMNTMMISMIWSIFTVMLGESSIWYLIQMYLYPWTSDRNFGIKWPYLTPMKKMVTLQVTFDVIWAKIWRKIILQFLKIKKKRT